MPIRLLKFLSLVVPLVLLAAIAPAQAQEVPTPDQILESDLTVEVELVGTMPFELGPGFNQADRVANVASPVSIGKWLYLIDQNDGIYRTGRDGTGPLTKVFDVDDDNPGDGLTLDKQWAVLNMSAGKGKKSVYVMLSSSTEPTADIPINRLPDPLPGLCCDPASPFEVPDLYRIGEIPGPLSFFGPTSTEWQVLYEFEVRRDKLVEPRPIVAFETQYGPTHNGGGMITVRGGRVLYSTGDGLTFGADGRAAAQDPGEHVGKWLLVNTRTGSHEVAAVGVRNSQRIELARIRAGGRPQFLFPDIGGVTAEEINAVSVRDLLDTRYVENFGWGRNPDGKAREGLFYITPGLPVAGAEPAVDSVAPSPEPGFIQPHAQYGRNDPNGGIAVSGPVTSRQFREITMLFSDLDSGIVYATTDPPATTAAPIYRVNLVDENGAAIADLEALNNGQRVDPRFFRFPDGSAGVLLESTGTYYRLTERR